jgi:hypothetical protein
MGTDVTVCTVGSEPRRGSLSDRIPSSTHAFVFWSFGDFIFARVETRETGNAVSARQGPAGLDRGQDMDTLARMPKSAGLLHFCTQLR